MLNKEAEYQSYLYTEALMIIEYGKTKWNLLQNNIGLLRIAGAIITQMSGLGMVLITALTYMHRTLLL
jgi:hypothetical protein